MSDAGSALGPNADDSDGTESFRVVVHDHEAACIDAPCRSSSVYFTDGVELSNGKLYTLTSQSALGEALFGVEGPGHSLVFHICRSYAALGMAG